MKPVLSISAAMLLALSLAACDNDQANAENTSGSGDSTGENAQTNTASGDSNSNSDMAEQNKAGGESDSAMQGSAGGQSASEDMPRAAVAVLHGTQGNDDVSATIRFTPKNGGIAYTTEAQGLKAGEHGYHIHLYGDCSSSDGKSAGTHFNLKGSSKNPPQDIDRITGNLGNLDAGEDGSAQQDGMIEGASLTGAKAIIGRGVIVHVKANDASQPPMGATGARLACGVIGIAEPQSGNSSNGGSEESTMGSGSGSGSGSSSDSGSSMDSGSSTGSGGSSSASDSSSSN